MDGMGGMKQGTQEQEGMQDTNMPDMQGMIDMMAEMQAMMTEMMSSKDMSQMPKMMAMMEQLNSGMAKMHSGGISEEEYMKLPDAEKKKHDMKEVGADKMEM